MLFVLFVVNRSFQLNSYSLCLCAFVPSCLCVINFREPVNPAAAASVGKGLPTYRLSCFCAGSDGKARSEEPTGWQVGHQ